jgi:hypothetical protein
VHRQNPEPPEYEAGVTSFVTAPAGDTGINLWSGVCIWVEPLEPGNLNVQHATREPS